MEHNYSTLCIEDNETNLLPCISANCYETSVNISAICSQKKSQLKRPYYQLIKDVKNDNNLTVFSESEEEFKIKSEPEKTNSVTSEIVNIEPDVFRLEDLCRVCAKKNSNDMVEIFGTEGIKCDLQNKINLCLPIKVTAEDTLPLQVCRRCMLQLDLSHSLATTCLKAERTLSKMQREHQQLFENFDQIPCDAIISIPSTSNVEDLSVEHNNEHENTKVVILLEQQNPSTSDEISIKSIQCKICNKCYSNAIQLRNHYKLHHSLYLCNFCMDFTCSKLQELNIHLKNHMVLLKNSSLVYCCEKCGENFENNAKLKIHNSIEHEQSYPCSICNEIFKFKNLLHTHLLTHEPKKVKCTECDLLFDNSKSMRIHKNTHIYYCTFCAKKFKKESSLKGHLNKVHNKWFYNCVVCKAVYYNENDVINHFNTHSDEDKVKHLNIFEKTSPFKCSNCCKYYNDNKSLKNHKCNKNNTDLHCVVSTEQNSPQSSSKTTQENKKQQNSSEQKNICEYCERVFSKKKHLCDHIRYMHFYPRKYSCNFCDEKFYNLKTLKLHKNKKHSSEIKLYKCIYCDKKFKREQNMLSHSKIHNVGGPSKEVNLHAETEIDSSINSYNCIICNASFKNEEDVLNHFNLHDDMDKINTLKMFQNKLH